MTTLCEVGKANLIVYATHKPIEGFIVGTKVLTQDGYKNIENILVNDKLLTRGVVKNILKLRTSVYNGDVYNVYIKNHPNVITCTKEQLFYVREKKCITINNNPEIIFKNPVWKKANNLTTNDYYGMVINRNRIIPEFTFKNPYNFDKITIKLDKKEYWFIMGYFTGDGWLDETNRLDSRNGIRFGVKNNEDENEKLGFINNVIPLKNVHTINRRCKVFGSCDFLWYSIFEMFGKNMQAKTIPEWVQDAPIEFIHEFINGYIKSIGFINENECNFISTVSYNVALALQRLYLKLGHIFSVSKPTLTAVCGKTVCTYCINGNKDDTSFIEYDYVWYEPFHISKIKAIDTPVYDFKIENGHSYVVENKIICN